MKNKNLVCLTLTALLAVSCSHQASSTQEESVSSQQETASTQPEAAQSMAAVAHEDETAVTNVYYFHGKQRCKTCLAVQQVAQQAIEANYAQQPHVRFIEIDTSKKEHASLVEKYQVTWNALLVVKGDDAVNLTEKAFATAVNSPEVLVRLLQSEVDARLN